MLKLCKSCFTMKKIRGQKELCKRCEEERRVKLKELTGKEIIMEELKIWQGAYPKQKKLLEDFAHKIYFELRFRYLEDFE